MSKSASSASIGGNKNQALAAKGEPSNDPSQKWLSILQGQNIEMLMIGLPMDETGRVGCAIVEKLLADLQPNDALERMLASQLAMCHIRLASLVNLAVRHNQLEERLALEEHCDKVMTSFRRSMLAYKEYRTASKAGPLVAVQQINTVPNTSGRRRKLRPPTIGQGTDQGQPVTRPNESFESAPIAGSQVSDR